MFEKDGQTAEKILFDIIKVHFLRPGVRKKDIPHNKGQAHTKNKKQITAQDTIPYREMSKDGICRIRKGQYSKLIRFHDISYSLASKEEQDAIFEDWSEFHNYFDSSIPYSITLRSRHSDMKKLKEQIQVVKRDDEFSEIAREYSGMVQSQLSKGNNGRLIEKYITYTVEAKDINEARVKLNRIEADIIGNLKAFGVRAEPVDGRDRLALMYRDFHGMDTELPNNVRHANTKDIIAPDRFVFRNGKYFEIINKVKGRAHKRCFSASYLQITAPEISDKMLVDFLDLNIDQTITFQIRSIEQNEAVKLVKSKVTDLDRMTIEEQKKAVRSGYDMDIIPSDLNTYGNDAKRLLNDLQSRNERLFEVTIIFLHEADTRQGLETAVFTTAGVAQKYNCSLQRLNYLQEEGFASSLMTGGNQVPMTRRLTTTSLAIFVPFTTEELFMPGQSQYYGLNAISNNVIFADRKHLVNPNGICVGKPGTGKSFSTKREITDVYLTTDDDICINDPEAEYRPLVEALGGTVIKISATSRDHVNPMDLNMNYADDDNPLGMKSDFILSLCELIMGSRDGIHAEERSVIDRCLPLIYQKYFEDPIPGNMPVLGDLYECLLKQEEPQAKHIATALEIYVNGSFKVFNHHTNVDMDNRIVCFDTKELGKQLKKIGMLIVQDQVWNRVTRNRDAHKSTRYYMDEFHLLLKEEQTAAYSVEIWKRFRKWGGIPTGITQNIKDLFASREIENILENSDFIYILGQAAGDREILAKYLNISPKQQAYITNSGEGEGLLFFGNTIIPFKDRFDKSLKLYELMTTKPEEVRARDEKRSEA
ncbi:MAG: conjugal transfer protein TraE [Lachnospiraceae bacterium]|nr:conjugal transfer protein TraE [Lachnospiraceae bacterium]